MAIYKLEEDCRLTDAERERRWRETPAAWRWTYKYWQTELGIAQARLQRDVERQEVIRARIEREQPEYYRRFVSRRGLNSVMDGAPADITRTRIVECESELRKAWFRLAVLGLETAGA